jgi:beta-lactamase superfamily II metal-dependent hydrolase
MKLTIFQSGKGDCLLLTGKGDKGRILVDGGMGDAYSQFVAPALGKLTEKKLALDLVYVSHIDEDHIAGVLQLMDDHVGWRVHDFQLSQGNASHPPPDAPRPPKVKELWHNAFHELVNDNKKKIADATASSAFDGSLESFTNAVQIRNLLEESARSLLGTGSTDLVNAAAEQLDIASSIPQAIQLSRRVSPQQLGIPLNKKFGGKLAFVREDAPPPKPLKIGPLKLSVIGPFAEDLDVLRKDWNKWLDKNQERVAKLRKQAERDAERLGTSDIRKLLEVQIAAAEELGNRSEVTPPNLASLMLFVEEGTKTLLLTGDGHSLDILKGLEFHKKMDPQGRLHVDILKVQHHGAEFNIHKDFVKRVSADHYIFCGNGEHDNPDLRVLDLILDSRLKDVEFKATHPRAAQPFKFWLNSSESATTKTAAKSHMKAVQKLLRDRKPNSGGRLEIEFLEGEKGSFELVVD